MLAEIYIEALWVDEELADQVWETWNKGEIDDQVACIAWMMIAVRSVRRWSDQAGSGNNSEDTQPKYVAHHIRYKIDQVRRVN